MNSVYAAVWPRPSDNVLEVKQALEYVVEEQMGDIGASHEGIPSDGRFFELHFEVETEREAMRVVKLLAVEVLERHLSVMADGNLWQDGSKEHVWIAELVKDEQMKPTDSDEDGGAIIYAIQHVASTV